MPNQISIIVIYDNYGFSVPIEYTFDLILSIYGVGCKVTPLNEFRPEEYKLDRMLVVSYGREYLNTGAKKQIHIYASDFFDEKYLKPQSMPQTPLPRYQDLPIIYSGSGRLDYWVAKSGNLIETNIDIVASAFFMISRYEEVIIDAKDQHDRFPATASLAYKENFLDRPIVNEYIELLWEWIHSLAPDLQREPLWPQNKKFAICLTHDVDNIRKYSYKPPVLIIGGAIVHWGKPGLAFHIALEYLAILFHLKKDPYDTFDYITNLEKSSGFKSSFYFKAGGNSKHDSNDTIKKSRVARLMKSLEKKGCEIGLHPSFHSYNNLRLMASEKSELDKKASNRSYGCRQHYLRWKSPDTWRIQEQLGILYDTSLGFADHIGFRCGFCFPFKPFDVMENRIFDIWELPLTVMEGSLQSPGYQNLSSEEAYEEIIRHIEIVRKFGGVFVLLWHNSALEDSGNWKGWKKVYEETMRYMSQQGAFVSNGREIIDCWNSLNWRGLLS